MSLDQANWLRILDALPAVEVDVASPLAVAFVAAEDFGRKCGCAWLWWPDSRRAAQRCNFDGRYPDDWGLLLVMNDAAIAKVGADGTASMAHLVRRLDIKPFVLRSREELDAAGVLEFIETLELATPKH